MESISRPCFETLQEFERLDPDTFDGELPVVKEYLNRCPASSLPTKSYLLVKQFLIEHAESTRYSNYRRYIERLLLWSILEAKKPITDLNEGDLQAFMSFCTSPPDSWVADKSCRRFTLGNLRQAIGFNPAWRPFSFDQPPIGEDGIRLTYIAGRGALAKQWSVVATFFLHLHYSELIAVNPARRLHAAGFYALSLPIHTGANIFTDEEFAVLMLTLGDMADEDIQNERTLLMMASVYYLRMQPSEIDSLGNKLTFSALGLMRDGTYDLVEDNFPGNRAWKIHPEFVAKYVNRYREKLGQKSLPLERDHTLLFGKIRGKGSISSAHARELFRTVCQVVIDRLTESGHEVSPDSGFRKASLFWLRETGMHHSARTMGMDDVIRLVRKSNAESAYRRFFAWRG
ncbi:hypothetical protein KC131_04565 [Pseudomonas sp. JQ170]|uniref:hypothetical protein n=1 Tax=unclassified Pseudomonas TaxID=196821 RepID=UPI002651BA0D|nr:MULTISPECIES: hypothetical protein [unclassified Pseudomonas]MDN7139908.1 hypothetical protein [Pseudomonas sp. JQ170]WRO73642.1 hypothetical protein U9R80_13965 [Pseudomonas sp. 170C]